MSCNCTKTVAVSPSGEPLPSVADDAALASSVETCKECYSDPSNDNACESEGTSLDSTWLNNGCYTEGVTLLGRIGNKLARLGGTGFIKIANGAASVVQSVPLQLTTLWHRWWKPTALSRPVLGEPLAYPYLSIADANGNLHAVKGPADEQAAPVWDPTTKEFTNLPLSELPLSQKGLLPRAASLELVGYAAIPSDGSAEAVRNLTTLAGEGIIIVTKQDTVDATCACEGCDPVESKASVATFLPNPTEAGTYSLKVTVDAEGVATHSWEADA